jgi:hypothetical protein
MAQVSSCVTIVPLLVELVIGYPLQKRDYCATFGLWQTKWHICHSWHALVICNVPVLAQKYTSSIDLWNVAGTLHITNGIRTNL